MTTLAHIREPISAPLIACEDEIARLLHSEIAPLQQMSQHFVSASGKHIRPIVVFLSGGLLGKINAQTVRLSVLLELLHSASLIHDDVIDDSATRRNKPTINALWGNKNAVMFGDYILGKCLSIALPEDSVLMPVFSYAAASLAEGEILQGETAHSGIYTEERYYDIIRRKTGSLFCACSCGAAQIAGATETQVEAMKTLGMNIGIMFQIKDDILDYLEDTPTGKEHGNDIREGKVTLPLIYLLQNYPERHAFVMDVLQNTEPDAEKLHALMHEVVEKGGIHYAQEVVHRLHKESADLLSIFPDTDYKTALLQLLSFLETRTQ